MTYEISWLVENQVIHLELEGDISLETVAAMSQSVIEYIETSEASVIQLLVDDRNVQTAPKDIHALLSVSKVFRHPRLGWFIVYGNDNKLFQFLTMLMSRLTRIRHRRFTTQAEAVAFLQSVDSMLNKRV
jgi:hypothetical protein